MGRLTLLREAECGHRIVQRPSPYAGPPVDTITVTEAAELLGGPPTVLVGSNRKPEGTPDTRPRRPSLSLPSARLPIQLRQSTGRRAYGWKGIRVVGNNAGPRLELTWHGKDKFLLSPKDDSGKPVWVERDHPAASEVRLTDFTVSVGDVSDNPYADNLLFTGDSLDMLRVLAETPEFRQEYRGKIKLVYIDPPFNTGQTFTNYDDWMDHSTWLSFMRDRLLLIKELLAPGGSVWVHLDNYEVHRMKVLLDEIFGADQFLNTIIWKRTTAKSSAVRSLGTMYDSITGYGKSSESKVNKVLMPYSEEYLASDFPCQVWTVRRRHWQPSQDYLSGIFRDLRPKFRVVIQIANNLTIRGLDAHSLDHVARKSSGIELSIRVERRCE